MDKNTKISIIVIVILLAILMGIIVYANLGGNNEQNSLFGSSNNSSTEKIVPIEDANVEYTEAEEKGEYKDYSATIDLNNMSTTGNGVTISGTQIKITSAGTYYFSGESEDANIVVEADKTAEVILVFDNCNITSTKTAVINGIKAETIVVNLASGSSNTFTDAKTYTEFTEDDEPNATIFSKTDLVINGSGKLTINSNYQDGIASKDVLKIVNTNLKITSADDAIRGKDGVAIKNSNIEISSEGDGIKATNTDENLGYIQIDGEETTINITKSYEGIEGSYIKINGGKINVVASDDGINIAGGNDSSAFGRTGENTFTSSEDGRKLVINGGTINVKASGDGLDANGSITITGGTITVAGAINGGNGPLDYDGTCNVSGGSLIVYGSTGMWQNPSNSSTQYTIAFNVTGNSGDKIELKDSNGNTVASTTTNMAYGAICISNDKLEKGETYTLYINGTSKGSQELTSIVTSNVNSNGGMGGRPMR